MITIFRRAFTVHFAKLKLTNPILTANFSNNSITIQYDANKRYHELNGIDDLVSEHDKINQDIKKKLEVINDFESKEITKTNTNNHNLVIDQPFHYNYRSIE
jgi:hypothetical protein